MYKNIEDITAPCSCWDGSNAAMYNSDTCKEARMNSSLPPMGCNQTLTPLTPLPPPTTGVSSEDEEIQTRQRKGFDFGGLFSGLAEGLKGATDSAKVTTTQLPNGNVRQTTTTSNESGGRNPLMPLFVILGGAALIGVTVLVVKNMKSAKAAANGASIEG